ncbi:MAG: diguanylate cyclase [Gaiellales bacterium]|nr:MAG: diguanylate cyclase [Gaiellales bacterium]
MVGRLRAADPLPGRSGCFQQERQTLFQKLSSKVVSGFVAVVAVFSIIGLVVTHELGEVRSSAAVAMDRAEAVQDIKDVTAAASEQMQAVYELILDSNLGQVNAFTEAGERRRQALDDAVSHAESSQELAYLEQLQQSTEQLDDIILNRLVPAWESGDRAGAIVYEKEADGLLVSIKNKATVVTSSFDERNVQAREASERASAEARSYLILAAIVGISLSLFVTVITYRRLNRPVTELKEASMAMIHGDMERRVRVTTDDEVGELGRSFNLMAAAVQDKIGQLTNLSEIALAISSELDWSRVLDVVMDKGIELTGSDAAAIVLYDEEKRRFTDVYTSGLSDDFTTRMRFRRGGLAERVIFGDQAVFSDDIQAHHRLSKLAREEGITAFICLPLKVRKRKLGVFYVYSKKTDAYGREEVAVLSILSNQAAIAIQNAMMYERSQEKALTDGLTGLYNQRHFYARLHEEVERAERSRKPLSIIFCDLDHFKAFNDTNGHALGDQALKEAGRVITESKRAIDVAARYGGEEFALILPDTDSSGAQIIAHRIRRRVAALEFESKAKGPVSLTVSIGVASYPNDAANPRELVEKADWSMYHSKRHGRDRVTLFHEAADAYGDVSKDDLVREEFKLAAAQAIAVSVARRDEGDAGHSESVARLSSAIAEALNLDEEVVQQVRVAGLLHDIGLVSVPPDIINKREELSEEDWRRIREHPEAGTEILKHISSLEGFLPVVRHHHEHYDGAGYPDGLKREEIPLGARIIAVADAYQAMISDRPYRKAMPPSQALIELQRGAGRQFDPVVVELFIRMMGDYEAKAS